MKSEVGIQKSEVHPRSSRFPATQAVLLGLTLATASLQAQFATSVESYTAGTGAGTRVDPNTALGTPSTQTVDPDPMWGGTYAVDPFSSPYLASQVVSIGDGGSLTVGFATPILNHSANPFGLDFLIFGNSFFNITNGVYDGGGLTDGALGGEATGSWRISVSADGANFYALQPSLTPVFDSSYPTDGQGDFRLPVNPALNSASFAGLGLAGIRALYAGSAGGTGYDLAWARDGQGQAVALASVSYVRVESLGGVGQIDGFAAAVPEPGSFALGLLGLLALGLMRRGSILSQS